MAPAKKKTTKSTKAAKPAAKSTKKTSARKTAKAAAPESAVAEVKILSSKSLLSAAKVDAAIKQLANGIYKEFPSSTGLVLLGIRTRGVFLAERLKDILETKYKTDVALGILDITFYRDDLSRLGPNPMVRGSDLPFDIYDAHVILVDDVLYTGRTVRAALDEISDFGRPSMVRLAILVDRGLRELPIHPDYCGLDLKTKPNQRVRVCLDESDDKDEVILDTLG